MLFCLPFLDRVVLTSKSMALRLICLGGIAYGVLISAVKGYALLTMNRQGWLTRDSSSLGGEGQSAASLTASSHG